MSELRKVRWGHVHELDRRVRCGTKTFFAQPQRLQQLQAWRAMHLLRSHKAVHSFGVRQGIVPSSNLPIKKKVAFVVKRSR